MNDIPDLYNLFVWERFVCRDISDKEQYSNWYKNDKRISRA